MDSARTIISVIGTGMEQFPTDAHPVSWVGMCLGDHESVKTKVRKNPKRKQAATDRVHYVRAFCCKNQKSFFHAQYKRISVRRGSKRAYVAVAYSLYTIY